MAIDSDGKTAASVGKDGSVCLWRLSEAGARRVYAGRLPVARGSSDFAFCAVAPTGTHALVAPPGRRVVALSLATGLELAALTFDSEIRSRPAGTAFASPSVTLEAPSMSVPSSLAPGPAGAIR